MPQGFVPFRELGQAPASGEVSMAELVPSHEVTTAGIADDGTFDTAVDHLSTALATGMSLAGGGKTTPAGVVLAGIGGAGGEAWRQTIRAVQGRWDEVPPDLRRQAQSIWAEGVRQGGTEGFGRAFGGVLKLFGRGLYRGAQKPPEIIRREFRTVSRDALEEGIPLTRSGRGTQMAEDRLRASAVETSGLVDAAEQAGTRGVNPRVVAQSLQKVRDEIGDQPLREADLQQLQAVRDQFLKENPAQIPLGRAQRMKQKAQDQAERAYRLRERGAPVNSVQLAADEAIARGFRESIERRVPTIAPQNARTQRLIGVARATERAEDRIANRDPFGMGDALSLGSGAATASTIDPMLGAAVTGATTLMNRPEIASRVAIGLNRSGSTVGPQTLRALDELLRLSDLLVPMPAHSQGRR